MKAAYLNIQSYLFLLLVIIINASCDSQNKPSASKTEYDNSILVLKEEEQIAAYIRHIFQDKNGNYWFGTNGYGAVHFDGDSLSYFSLEQGFDGSQINGIAEDIEKNIWFATDKGVVKYAWSNTLSGEKLFTNYSDKALFNGKRFRSIFADSKGTIWAGAVDGVFRFDGTTWEAFELPYTEKHEKTGLLTGITILSIMEDTKGNIWFATYGNGAIKYNGKSFVQYTKKDGLAGNNVDPIIEDRNGDIWLGTRFGGLSHFNGTSFTNYTSKDSIGNNEVCIVYEDTKGDIWLSSEGFGVYRFDGTSFSNYFKKQGLEVQAVQAIYEDKAGQLWVGGGGGLYRFDGTSFSNITKNGPWG